MTKLRLQKNAMITRVSQSQFCEFFKFWKRPMVEKMYVLLRKCNH